MLCHVCPLTFKSRMAFANQQASNYCTPPSHPTDSIFAVYDVHVVYTHDACFFTWAFEVCFIGMCLYILKEGIWGSSHVFVLRSKQPSVFIAWGVGGRSEVPGREGAEHPFYAIHLYRPYWTKKNNSGSQVVIMIILACLL